jgi:hypothetical protein
LNDLLEEILLCLEAVYLYPNAELGVLLKELSLLFNTCSIHQQNILKKVTKSVLFNNPTSYEAFFKHLTGEELKYHPDPQVSALLSCLQDGGDPVLLLASCPSQPSWLPIRLCSTLLFLADCPSLVNKETVLGGQLARVPKFPDKTGRLLSLLLPVDLSVDVTENLQTAKYLQSLVSHSKGTAEVVCLVHKHHPQLLDPLLAQLMTWHLESDSLEIFPLILDVALKLRQLPKLVSKFFLHLRTLDTERVREMRWKEGDLALFGQTLPSLPRVQILEIWKTLNYHLTSDCISLDSKSEAISSLLSPILVSLFTNSQLADHNLPSTLMVRIQDLVQGTLDYMNVLFLRDCHNVFLAEVICALSDFTDLLIAYRGNVQFENVFKLKSEVAAKIQESKEGLESVDKLISNQSLQYGKNMEENLSGIQEMSDDLLLKALKSNKFNSNICEDRRFGALFIFSLLEKVNSKEEILHVPPSDIWSNKDQWTDLQSYLGKQLGSGLQTLFHTEVTFTDLSSDCLNNLSKLPLEHLPSVLKLGATLLCLSQVLGRTDPKDQSLLLTARCLESSDLFRYVDAGRFLLKILSLEGDSKREFLAVVCKGIGNYSKTIQDVKLAFQDFEQIDNAVLLKVSVNILSSLNGAVCRGMEGTHKKDLAHELAHKFLKYYCKNFKNNFDLDNPSMMNLLVEGASEIVSVCAKSGLGKASKYINKVVDYTFTEGVGSWKDLLHSICLNLEYFDEEMLPEDWKSKALILLGEKFDDSCVLLLESLFNTFDNDDLECMLSLLLEKNLLNPILWDRILRYPVDETYFPAKKAAVERALAAIINMVQEGLVDNPKAVLGLFGSLFSSSPCVSSSLEALCLGCLVFLPKEMAPELLQVIATFLSHRTGLSTKTIPLVTALIRHCISSDGSLPTLHSLQNVLGLFSRNKADWSSVAPYLLSDLLLVYPTLQPSLKPALMSSLLPLLDSLDKHNTDYLAANLPVAAGELFKHAVVTHTNHKFKGKV